MSKTKTIQGKTAPQGGVAPASSRERVVRWLENAITSGEIPRGGEIPSERALAKLLGVAKNTAAAAVDEAVVRGLVICREGTRRRYAGAARGGSLSSSTIFVLAALPSFSDLATAPGWSDEFLALNVVRQISLMGRPVSFFNSASLPEGGLDAIFEARPGGMVVTGGVNNDPIAMRALARCREAGIPAATYGNAPELRGFDRAYSDHRAGSRELTRWLFAQGCRRIVPFFPSDPVLFWENERIEGYNEAMREAGQKPMPCAVFGDAELRAQTSGERHFRVFRALAISKLLELRREGGIDALLCLNDCWVPHVAAAMRELGLEPNRDIVLAGYDNGSMEALPSPFTCERPAVTIDKHNERSAEDLAALIVARMDGTLPPEPQARIHANELIVIPPEQANTKPGVKP